MVVVAAVGPMIMLAQVAVQVVAVVVVALRERETRLLQVQHKVQMAVPVYRRLITQAQAVVAHRLLGQIMARAQVGLVVTARPQASAAAL